MLYPLHSNASYKHGFYISTSVLEFQRCTVLKLNRFHAQKVLDCGIEWGPRSPTSMYHVNAFVAVTSAFGVVASAHAAVLTVTATVTIPIFVAALLDLVVLDTLDPNFLVLISVLGVEHTTAFKSLGHLSLTTLLKELFPRFGHLACSIPLSSAPIFLSVHASTHHAFCRVLSRIFLLYCV